MIYTRDELVEMLERVGGAIHDVDGQPLFCRIKEETVDPDEYGRVLSARQTLSHAFGDTHQRSARYSAVVDGVDWTIVHVRQKTSGIVVWTMERYTA